MRTMKISKEHYCCGCCRGCCGCCWRDVGLHPAVWSAIQMGNMEVEEVIERHVATLLMQDQAWISASAEFDRFSPVFPSSHHRLQGNVADEAAQYRRAHVRELGHA